MCDTATVQTVCLLLTAADRYTNEKTRINCQSIRTAHTRARQHRITGASERAENDEKMEMRLTGNRDENWPDICRNKLVRHLLCKHRNSHDCGHGPVVGNTDAVASCWLGATLLGCLAVESAPGSTVNGKRRMFVASNGNGILSIFRIAHE